MESIQISCLAKSFGELTVLNNFNITFTPNKIHCLFGPSGCGKTTLLQLIAGIMRPDRGQVRGVGNRTISYVFQEDRLLPWATVKENILFVLSNRYKDQKVAEQLADRYLSLVGMKQFQDYFPGQLSGGMKQRTAIARAFAYQGDILLLDEPFKGLDYHLKKLLMDYILTCWGEEKPVCLFVTHDPEEGLYLADVIHVLEGPPLKKIKELTIAIPHAARPSQKAQLEEYKQCLLAGLSSGN